ncbi:Phage tail protein [Pararobbsia alpina]|uniref:baseplate hub protein n=1 Tax=Pararobbsia alpina TaxID=621374 RepID=UPI0039A487A6
MSFTRKRIDVTISLGTGQFGDTGADTVTLTGLRVQAAIAVPGGDAMGVCQARIFGLPISMINQLTTVGPINTAIRAQNSILLAAGDDETGLQTAYAGTIGEAWGELQGAPEVPFNVIGFAGLIAAVKPVGALSFQGSVDAATIMSGLADTMGLTFENNGVSVQLSNPYFPGTALDQVRACARAADILYVIDRNVLAIWPKDGQRGGDVPLISPDTGMIGYPTFSSNGLGVTSFYNPAIKPGGTIQVKSSLPVACGMWNVFNLNHNIESETPDGAWFTTLSAYPKNGQ